MKYPTLLLLLGVTSVAEAAKTKSITSRRTPVKDVTFVNEDEGSDDDDEEDSLVQTSWTDPWGPGEDGIIDALTPPLEAC
jgi:hypothetical protein